MKIPNSNYSKSNASLVLTLFSLSKGRTIVQAGVFFFKNKLKQVFFQSNTLKFINVNERNKFYLKFFYFPGKCAAKSLRNEQNSFET